MSTGRGRSVPTSLAERQRELLAPTSGIVADTAELRRVLNLPYREPLDVDLEEFSKYLGSERTVLWEIQAETLLQLYAMRGCFGAIGVGRGKTLITYLAPRLMGAERPVLVVPAKLKKKTKREFAELEKEWGPSDITIRTVTIISRRMYETDDGPKNELELLEPDLLMIDECHRFKNPGATCTKRLRTWREGNRDVPMLAMSGTVTSRSLWDFWHLLEMVLGPELMPLPATPLQLDLWARAVDEKVEFRSKPGALRLFMPNPSDDVAAVRRDLGNRIFNTPGVVRSVGGDCEASIRIQLHRPRLPQNVRAIMQRYESWKVDVHGVELTPADIWRKRQTLALGFEEHWAEPGPEEWMKARAAYNRMLRDWLELEDPALDSEERIAEAAARGDIPNGRYLRWMEIKPTFTPVTVTRWYTTEILEKAIEMCRNRDVWIWTFYEAPGHKLKEMTGWNYYQNLGMDGRKHVLDHKKGPAILSVRANLEGLNLQHYHQNLVLTPIPVGETWEQMIGRTHRKGQQSDEVLFDLFCSYNSADFDQALADAQYQTSMNNEEPKKLMLADIYD